MTIQWRNDYCIGEGTIDEHHRKLVGLMSDLQQAMFESRARLELERIVDALMIHLSYHFAWEEQWLESHSAPGLAGHRDEHRHLATEVRALRKQLRAGRLTSAMPALQFLQNWLLEHFDVRDRTVVAAALRHGAAKPVHMSGSGPPQGVMSGFTGQVPAASP
jgi:hemerythrin-like metal-binding protein